MDNRDDGPLFKSKNVGNYGSGISPGSPDINNLMISPENSDWQLRVSSPVSPMAKAADARSSGASSARKERSAQPLNDISAINNATAPDTSMNTTNPSFISPVQLIHKQHSVEVAGAVNGFGVDRMDSRLPAISKGPIDNFDT